MPTGPRKARKRAGIKLVKPVKVATYSWHDANSRRGLGLTSGPEILAAIVTRGL